MDINKNIFNLIENKKLSIDLKNKFIENRRKNINLIEKSLELDETNPDIVFEYVKIKGINKENIKKYYDILTKEQINALNIETLKKNMNNKEIFFYLLNYLTEIEIIDFEKQSNISLIEEKNNNVNNDINKIIFEDNNSIKENIKNFEEEKKLINETEEKILELNLDLEKFNEKINLNPINIFDLEKQKKISYSELINKLNNFRNIFFYFEEKKKQFPDFESEYFYYYQIKYFLDTILYLEIDIFELKLLDLFEIKKFTQIIKNNEIDNNNIKFYYYFIICEGAKLNHNILNAILNFNIKSLEERKDEFKNIELSYDKLKDIAIFKLNNKIFKVENTEDYVINEKSILSIFSKEKKQLSKSLKYYLKNLEFSREKGNKFWEIFLKSQVVEDIISFYYRNIPSNIFKDKNVIKLFKDNSFYFPINIEDNLALCQKEVFKIYFGPKKENLGLFERKEKGKLWKIIDEAFYKIRIIHEWFHACQAYLFFCIKENEIFDSPKRIIKINEEEIENNEGGETIEILLFGRVIYQLKFYEALYILDDKNYNKSVEDFRKGFLELEGEKKNSNEIETFLNNNDNSQNFIIDGIKQYNDLIQKKKIKKDDNYKISKDLNNSSDIRNYYFSFKINTNHHYKKKK
jgi:hypothetical protein